MAEPQPQTADLAQLLFRLAGPGRRERQFAALGTVVVDALGAIPAPLAGIHHKERIGFIQAVLPGHIGRQHHDAVPHIGIGPAHRFVGAVHGVGCGDLVFQNGFGHRHRPPETFVGVILGIPQGIEAADGIGQGVLFPGVVVQIQGLDEVFVQQAGLMFPYQLGAQHPPQKAESRVRHAVGAGFPGFGVVVEHTAAHIIDDALKVIGHRKAAGDLDIGAHDLQQRRGKYIVGMEFAAVGKAVCGYFHNIILLMVGNCVFAIIPHPARRCTPRAEKKRRTASPHAVHRPAGKVSVAHLGAHIAACLPIDMQHLAAGLIGAAQILLFALPVLLLALL